MTTKFMYIMFEILSGFDRLIIYAFFYSVLKNLFWGGELKTLVMKYYLCTPDRFESVPCQSLRKTGRHLMNRPGTELGK